MNKFKPISQSTKISNRLFASFLAFGGIVIFAVVVGAALSPEVGFSVGIVFMSLLAVLALATSVYFWRIDTELTEDAQTQQEADTDAFLYKWYVRYPLAALFCGIAYLGYFAWQQDRYPEGAVLLMANPITAAICAILALIYAWELSLSFIVVGVLYVAYLGVASLPVSVAVIVGAIIIAIGVYKRKS